MGITTKVTSSGSSMSTLLIAIVVICAIVYGFLEFKKIHMRLKQLEMSMTSVMNDSKPELPPRRSNESDQPAVRSTTTATTTDTTTPATTATTKTDTTTDTTDTTTTKSPIVMKDVSKQSTSTPNAVPKQESMFVMETGTPNTMFMTSFINQLDTDPLLQVMVDGKGQVDDVIDVEETTIEEINDSDEVQDKTTDSLIEEVSKEDNTVDTVDTVDSVVESAVESVTAVESITDTIEEVTGKEVDIDDPVKEDGDDDDEDDDDDGPNPIQSVLDTMMISSGTPVDLIDRLIENPDHSLYTLSELKQELTKYNLPTSGNKTKLIDRLVSYKK